MCTIHWDAHTLHFNYEQPARGQVSRASVEESCLNRPASSAMRDDEHQSQVGCMCRSQTTVENCIGGHVNVLSDYKKT